MLSYYLRSRRQNVGRIAESENRCATAHHRKSPDAGKLLEAASGVEPLMEVLQTSGPGDVACALVRESAARCKRQQSRRDRGFSGVAHRLGASRQQHVGSRAAESMSSSDAHTDAQAPQTHSRSRCPSRLRHSERLLRACQCELTSATKAVGRSPRREQRTPNSARICTQNEPRVKQEFPNPCASSSFHF
jgi:hypothetical protein